MLLCPIQLRLSELTAVYSPNKETCQTISKQSYQLYTEQKTRETANTKPFVLILDTKHPLVHANSVHRHKVEQCFLNLYFRQTLCPNMPQRALACANMHSMYKYALAYPQPRLKSLDLTERTDEKDTAHRSTQDMRRLMAICCVKSQFISLDNKPLL